MGTSVGGNRADSDARRVPWASSTALFRRAPTTAVVNVIPAIVAALKAEEVRHDRTGVASQFLALTALDLVPGS